METAKRRVARVVLLLAAIVLISAGSCGPTDGSGTGPQNPPPGQPAPTDTDDGSRDQGG